MKLLNKLLTRCLPFSYVQKKYIEVGKSVGESISYLFTRNDIGFPDLVKELVKWEEEYASRGLRTINLERFVNFGGFGESIKDVLGKRREKGEEPVYHAKNYIEENLKKSKQ